MFELVFLLSYCLCCDVNIGWGAESVLLIHIKMSHIFLAIVDEINYVNYLRGSFTFLDWFQSVLCIPHEDKMKMRNGHCHSHQHVVFETAGVFPQKVLHIIANICHYLHMYVLLVHACNQVCYCVSFSECASNLSVSRVLWHSLSTSDYLHLFVFCVSLLMVVREVYICVPSHFQIVLFLFVSPIPCAPLSCLPCCLLNIQLNANRASVCVSFVVCSSPSNQNEQPKQ